MWWLRFLHKNYEFYQLLQSFFLFTLMRGDPEDTKTSHNLLMASVMLILDVFELICKENEVPGTMDINKFDSFI